MRNLRALLIVAAVAAGTLPSCATVDQKLKKVMTGNFAIFEGEVPVLPPEAPQLYRKAVEDLDHEKFATALSGFEEFLKQQPATRWTQAAIVNSARALEGLGRWTEAAERYRAAIRGTANLPKLQAMALYRLSFCAEALGDDPQTVATLHDVMSRQKFLPKEIARAELPARLAGAYARAGNFDKAVEYYNLAESGIARLKQESEEKDKPQWLGRTLFYMGNLSSQAVSWENFEASLRPLGKGQVYLLQAAELSQEPWSSKASQSLMSIYRDLWTVIENAPMPAESDPLIARREVQERQWDLAVLVLEKIQELRARRLPEAEGGDKSEEAKKVFAFLDDLEKEIHTLLRERPAGEGLTPESIQRQQSVRGRVMAPDSELESQYLKSHPKTLPATSLPEKDPNL